MEYKSLIKVIICASIILDTSCIHTPPYEVKHLEMKKENVFPGALSSKNLEIKNIVYSEDKFPLSDFFEKLMAGEFNESFKQINLSYKPSNTKNEILQKLLSNGLIPVYVSIKNNSSTDVKVSFNQFNLANESEKFQALSPTYLPNKVKQFSPTAVAANIYNVTIAITVGVMIALLLRGNGVPNLGSGGKGSNYSNSENESKSDGIFNKTEFTTHIYYENYVINEKIIKPDEVFYGLLFFKPENIKGTQDFFLEFSEDVN